MDALNPAEVRILGSLVEKDLTTPDYYPLTLNALTNASNQSSNRYPVVTFSEEVVVRALDSLREKKLAFMFEGADSRVPRYGHRIVESFQIDRPATAILCVLLLRGPQTVGEIRGRTSRMYEFAGLEEAEASLSALAILSPLPLVVRLPRQAGMKEQRFAHLLAGEVMAPPGVTSLAPEPAAPAVRFENERITRLEGEAVALRSELTELRRQLADFRKMLE